MNAFPTFALAFLVPLLAGACGNTPDGDVPQTAALVARTTDAPPDDASCSDLVGTWELVSISDDSPALTGAFATDPNYQVAPTLKIINDTHWMFIRQSAERFIYAQGGRYARDPSGVYKEHVEYSALPENVGQEFVFECHVEGDSLWHHIGGQGDSRYDELWRRIR